MGLADYHVPEFAGVADAAATVTAGDLRVTVLSDRLLRIEFDPESEFEDRPSQTVWYRDQPVPDFHADVTDGHLTVETAHLELHYDTDDGPDSLSVTLTEWDETYHYGESGETLGGTTRTLDAIDGPADLDDGLLARDGWTVLEDTDSLVFDDDGWVTPRDAADGYEDRYFFGYGHDYLGCLRDFQRLTGDTPMVPRWALGNWWSRYWEYSESELRALLERFREESVPLSVCVVDMDWHVVENEYHEGWTGWTWDTDLFPDPPGFLSWLADIGLRTTLNLHPAEGVHAHEDAYPAIAEHVGIDPDSEHPVEFDASDTQFLRGYFEHVIDPLEEQGVDFWWIDWQQWEESPEMDGLDPLWALNHLHALDRTRDGRRPFILSRWAGPGNHRYPVGFSGDTVVSWDSFAFQPYMTATGGNVGCSYWSHDIGGHFGGTGDLDSFGELYARWTQFGALSPINRIHTANMPYVDKRPWRYDGDVRDALVESLRFRHALVPYLYTLARATHERGVPMVRPLYYHHPEVDAAYHRPNQYYLGRDLVVAPHTDPREESTNLARRVVWLPDGEWVDFHTGRRYDGGFHVRYGDLSDVPLYARAGAVVPMDAAPSFGDTDAPEALSVVVVPGADNRFDIYEDDGVSQAYRDGEYAETPVEQHWHEDWLAIEIGPARGETDLLPAGRDIELQVRGVGGDIDVTLEGGRGDVRAYDTETDTLSVVLSEVAPDDEVTVYLDTDDASLRAETDRRQAAIEEMLWRFEMPAGAKPKLREYARGYLTGSHGDIDWLGDFAAVLNTAQLRAVAETLTDTGYEHVTEAGRERLVLFNGDRRSDVTYQFATYDNWGVPIDRAGDAERGTVPEYRVVDIDARETLHWELGVNYADVFRVEDSGEGRDTTQD